HLVVCDGNFNAAATKYKWAFVDGIRFDLDERAAPPAGASAEAAAAPAGRGGRGQRGQRGQTDPATPATPNPVAHAPTPPGGLGGFGGLGAGTNQPPFNGTAFRAIISMLDGAETATTEIEADRTPATKTGGNVLIRGATVITLTGKTLDKADILVANGKIKVV